jgi:hypothetical protein
MDPDSGNGKEVSNMRRLKLSLTLLSLLTFSTVARAGVIETASSRTSLVDADTGTGAHTTDSSTGPSIYGLFDDSLTTEAHDGDLFAQGNTYHNSTIAPGHYSGLLDINATADAGQGGFDIVDGFAQTKLSVNFTLNTSMDFAIAGNLYAVENDFGDTALAKVVIKNLGGGGSPTQVIGQEHDDLAFFNVSGSLLPGSYQLEIETLAVTSRVFVTSWSETRAGVDFNMTLTPEPGALALLALGGLAVLRRR